MTSLSHRRGFAERAEVEDRPYSWSGHRLRALPSPSNAAGVGLAPAKDRDLKKPFPLDFAQRLTRAGALGLRSLSRCQVHFDSRASGWQSVFLSRQTEGPFSFKAVAQQYCLFIVNLTGPVCTSVKVGDRLKQTIATAGAVTFLPPGQAFEIAAEDRFDSLHVYLDAGMFRETVLQIGQGDFAPSAVRPMLFESDELLNGMMIEAWQNAEHDPDRPEFHSDHFARSVTSHLLQRSSPWKSPALVGRKSALSKRDIDLLTQFIAERMEDRITINDLAAVAGYSPSHFCRSFKAATGKRPYHYVLEMRIEKSKHLLRFSDLPIVSIALRCGFSDQEHFSHTFRKHEDSTPMRFRRQMRDGLAPH